MLEINPETNLPVLPKYCHWEVVKEFRGVKTVEGEIYPSDGPAILIVSGDEVIVASAIYSAEYVPLREEDFPEASPEEFSKLRKHHDLLNFTRYDWTTVTAEDIALSAEYAMATLSIMGRNRMKMAEKDRLFVKYPPNKLERNK